MHTATRVHIHPIHRIWCGSTNIHLVDGTIHSTSRFLAWLLSMTETKISKTTNNKYMNAFYSPCHFQCHRMCHSIIISLITATKQQKLRNKKIQHTHNIPFDCEILKNKFPIHIPHTALDWQANNLRDL